MRARSARTQERYKNERIPFVQKLLAERPTCERCQRRKSVDVHEKLSRGRSGGVRGEDWLDPNNCVCLCHRCHTWVGNNTAEAEEEGWLVLPSI